MNIPWLSRRTGKGPKTRTNGRTGPSIENRGYTLGGLDSAYTAAQGPFRTPASVVAACATMWSSALASARLYGASDTVKAMLHPGVLHKAGHDLLIRGESLWALLPEQADVLLEICEYNYKARDRTGALYECTLATGETLTLGHAQVAHLKWLEGADGRGVPPNVDLATKLDSLLLNEISGPHGYLLPIPRNPGEGTLTGLKATLAKMKGRTAITETMSGGWGSGDIKAPKGPEYQQQRIGADPPATLATLRMSVCQELATTCGVPWALIGVADGTSMREAYRRFVYLHVMPKLHIWGRQWAALLGVEVLQWTLASTWSTDLQGRSSAVQRLVAAFQQDPTLLDEEQIRGLINATLDI